MSLGKTCALSSGASFCPQEHNLNKIGRGSLNDVICYISMPSGFRQGDFLCSSNIRLLAFE